MKKFISLMNAQSIYYLWNNLETKNYLERIIEYIIGEELEYELMDTFNDQNGNLKSYVFFESNEVIIHFDFDQENVNQDLINFVKLTSGKRVITIIFNTYKLYFKKQEVDVYYLYKTKDNIPEIKLFLSTKLKEQKKYDNFGITEFLYNLDDEFYKKYLNEFKKGELFKKI